MDALDRREFLAIGGAALAASMLPARAEAGAEAQSKDGPFASPPIELVRIGDCEPAVGVVFGEPLLGRQNIFAAPDKRERDKIGF